MLKIKKGFEPNRSTSCTGAARPLSAIIELLGRRWALQVLWELRNGEYMSFRTLQERCQISSPNLLNARLKELWHAQVIDQIESAEFGLSELGR